MERIAREERRCSAKPTTTDQCAATTMMMLKLAGLLVIGAGVASAGGTCTFTPNCDYGKGSRDNAPATSKEECCSACEAAAKKGCVAGVWDGAHCWFKTAGDIAHGCTHSARSKFACLTSLAPKPPAPPAPPSPEEIALEKQYSQLKETTCAKVTAKAPALNAADEATFMNAYSNLAKNGSDTEPVLTAAEKLLDAADVKAFLSAPDSFTEAGLDGALVLCSVLTQATPDGLAKFAASGKAEEVAVTQLLGDFILMRDMLVAGGTVASENGKGKEEGPKHFGQAMGIYLNITKASASLSALDATAAADAAWDDQSPANVLKRLALGTALQHSVPLHRRYSNPLDPSTFFIDPVERYMDYEHAYKAGNLDPAFEVLTAFEMRHTTNTDASTTDQQWARESLAIYRPEHIASGYGWRYTGAVKTDVAYGDPQCAKYKEGVCSGHMSDIPAADGVCGPRAFFGRFIAKSFGLPTWGATEPGHAAMSVWQPSGWRVLLGAGWPSAWWGERGGVSWFLETQARRLRPTYQQVLRGHWLADAKNETKCAGRGKLGQGGTWNALMWSLQTASVAKTPPTPRQLPAKSLVPTKVEAIGEKFKTKPTAAPISTDPKDGTITIPAAAFSSKNRSASVSISQSADAGTQIMHGGCASAVGPPCAQPLSSSFEYQITVADAGEYYLTANHTTWHPNQNLSVSVNDSPTQDVPVYYTVGWWNETEPIEVQLTKGQNTLSFTRSSCRPLVFKDFKLYKKKPDVRPPPGNFTPTPAPVYPDKAQYIEVPANTNCIKQGIDPVPAEDCSRACGALGFKSTGPRARANISGCFVMTDGPYKGNCNFNTNKSATCEPPCTLMGVPVQSLCLRK